MGISQGTVRKLGKKRKRWYIDIRVDGQRIQKPVSESKQAANAYLEAFKTDYYRGELRFKKDSTTRFQDYAKKYLEYSKVNKRSWQRDQASIKALNTFFGSMLLSKINADHIEAYKKQRVENKLSSASINRELACLSAIFTLAIKAKIVDLNPVLDVKKLTERKLKMKILNKDEAERLIECANERLKTILLIALNTGMRRGEILSLRWNDIDFKRNYLVVRETKSGRPRKIPMNGLVEDALKGIKQESEFVFFNPGTQDRLKDVKTGFKAACRRAGIKDLRFHDLRHTAATWMDDAGVGIVTISKILGHSDIRMTEKYTHPRPENELRAVEALAAVFGEFGEIWGDEKLKPLVSPSISVN